MVSVKKWLKYYDLLHTWLVTTRHFTTHLHAIHSIVINLQTGDSSSESAFVIRFLTNVNGVVCCEAKTETTNHVLNDRNAKDPKSRYSCLVVVG